MNIPFPKQDWGLGTAYERVAVYRLLDQWLATRSIRSAFEGPIDGMAGIPGIHFMGQARRGTPVEVGLTDRDALENVRRIYESMGLSDRLTTRYCDPDAPLPERAWDAVLTYNAFPLIADWRGLLERVARASRRWVIVAVTNPVSYGAMIRKAIRVVEPSKKMELFDHESTRPDVIELELRKIGRIASHAYFDCPWWPDLFVDAGESLLGSTLKRLPVIGPAFLARKGERGAAPTDFVYGAGRFPLLDHDAELDAALARHPAFDRAPQPIAKMFGHLHAYLVEREA
jgi:hypothetical protein